VYNTNELNNEYTAAADIHPTEPISFHVARWSNNPYSKGAWSQLLVGGSPRDREQLSKPISNSFILAGEATVPDFPSQVHGAYVSGKRAAKWCLDSISSNTTSNPLLIVVIGAGAAGISAADTIRKSLNSDSNSNPNSHHNKHKVIIVEALDHLGGRATTISMGDGINVDAGGTWIQQYKNNPLVPEALRFGLHLIPTDFMNPIASCGDGPVSVDEINEMVLQIETAAQIHHKNVEHDTSVMKIINDYIYPRYQDNPRMLRLIELSIAEIMADTGIPLDTLSSNYGLEEPSYVGEGDHYIREGFSALLSKIACDIEIRYNTPIKVIDWGEDSNYNSTSVKLTTSTNEVINADYCICTIPISILQESTMRENTNKTLTIQPPLPIDHQNSLNKMKMAICDKVILRFTHRWWPTSPTSNNILKWYGDRSNGDNNNNYGNSYTDILDATDGLGVPLVVLYMIGADNVKKHIDGRTDKEIAYHAYKALQDWSISIKRDKESFIEPKV
jgi:monoamine oxidase